MGAVFDKGITMSINWSDIDKSVIIHEPEPLILTPECRKVYDEFCEYNSYEINYDGKANFYSTDIKPNNNRTSFCEIKL